MVEVRYAGVGIGRSTLVRDWTSAGAFIGLAEPMPTGTPLFLKGEGVEQAARVLEVTESADLAVAGMRVVFVGGAEAVRPVSTPAAKPAVAAAPAPVAKAAPVVEASVVEAPAVVAPAVEVSPAAETVSQAAADTGEAPAAAPGATGADAATEAPPSIEGEAGSSAGSGKRRRRRK